MYFNTKSLWISAVIVLCAGALNVSDPNIQWDPQGQRWFYSLVGFSSDFSQTYLLLGWSKTADPTDLAGGWCRFGIASGWCREINSPGRQSFTSTARPRLCLWAAGRKWMSIRILLLRCEPRRRGA